MPYKKKQCSVCGKNKPIKTGFHPNAGTPDGHMYMCKSCFSNRLKNTGHIQKQKRRKKNPSDVILVELDNRIALLQRKRDKYIQNAKLSKTLVDRIIKEL